MQVTCYDHSYIATERNLSRIASDKRIRPHYSYAQWLQHFGKTEGQFFSLFNQWSWIWLTHKLNFLPNSRRQLSVLPPPYNFKTQLDLRIIYFLWVKTEVTYPLCSSLDRSLAGQNGCVNCPGSILLIDFHRWGNQSTGQVRDVPTVYYITNKCRSEITDFQILNPIWLF